MKKPRKKHNKTKRDRKLASIFTTGLGIARVNENNCEVVDLRKGCKYKKPTRTMVHQFTQIPHKWTILLCVFCTESNGKRKLVSDQLNLADARYQDDIADFLSDEHSALIVDCESVMTVNDVAWIASPTVGIDFDIEQSSLLLESLGAWCGC